MHITKNGIMKSAVFFLMPVLMLTACMGKNDDVFDIQDKEEMPVTEFNSDIGIAAGEATAQSNENASAKTDTEEPPMIYVHICGAVMNPGVYELKADSRIFEGIEAAGGFRDDACEDYVNQAKLLQDGQRLAIPTMDEVDAAKENGFEKGLPTAEDSETDLGISDKGSAGGLVNINTADENELSSIAGIGAGKAAAIVRYRKEHGSFQSVEDIMKVSGIKEGTYEKIKEKITVK